jgi:hypothetical protein
VRRRDAPALPAHWAGNGLAHVGARNGAAAAAMLETIFARGGTRRPPSNSGTRSPTRSGRSIPKLGEPMGAAREEVLACMAFPKGRRPRITQVQS